MNKTPIFALLCIIILAGCTTRPSPIGPIQKTEIPPAPSQAADTLIPVATPISTTSPAPVISTPTPTLTPILPTQTPTVPPEAHLKFQDLEILPKLPGEAHLTGTFVLVSPFDYLSHQAGVNKPNQLSLWNLEIGTKRELLREGEYFLTSSASPDQQWLAYTKNKPHNGANNLSIGIVNASGDQKVSISWEEGWGGASAWLDNQHLVIRRPLIVPESTTLTGMLLLNPFTGQRQSLPPDPKDIYDLSVNPIWEDIGEASYDPAMTRRVYPNENHEIVLEDLKTHQILLHFPAYIVQAVPRWSPDGEEFVITHAKNYVPNKFPNDWELYSITKDGQMTRLTNLTAYCPTTFIIGYSWSPDGRKIAFWLSPDYESWGGKLSVLDIETQEVTVYNIESGIDLTFPLRPIWSPDSQELLIGVIEGKSGNVTSEYAMVVDPMNGWAAVVAKDMVPMGWMVNIP